MTIRGYLIHRNRFIGFRRLYYRVVTPQRVVPHLFTISFTRNHYVLMLLGGLLGLQTVAMQMKVTKARG